MKIMKNKQWILSSFPKGDIQDGDLVFQENELSELKDNEILVRNIYLSLDPANRGWMSGQASYVDAMQIGDVMRGGTIGVIEESKNEKFKKGDIVNCMGGWQEYLISDGKGVRTIPQNTGFPLDSFMSVLGMTGMTAYFGLLDITDPKEGETLVVSAAAVIIAVEMAVLLLSVVILNMVESLEIVHCNLHQNVLTTTATILII